MGCSQTARAALTALAALAAVNALAGAPAEKAQAVATEPITVVLVRHAEALAASRAQPDPELAAPGRERAKALGALLSGAGVTHLFSSEWRRTSETLAPLAELSGRAVKQHPGLDASGMAVLLRGLPAGSLAVVAAHSNTLPMLAAELGLTLEGLTDTPQGPALPHESHERVFVLSLPGGVAPARLVVELRVEP